MERVLVTGAAGYIGRHVVTALLDLGYDVTAVDFSSDGIDARAHYISCDIFSGEEGLFEKLGKPERLIHLAWKDGFVHGALSHFEFLPKHYTFVRDMVAAGVKSVSVMGSMHEVGFYEGAIDENTPTNPSSLYGISKNSLRQSLEVLSKTEKFSLKWIRGFYIYGDDKRNNSIFAKLLQKAEEGAEEFPFTTGVNKYDFIHVDHLAMLIASASVQDEVEGIINCCSGKSVALKDKVEQFIKENKLNIKLKYGAFPDRPYDSKEIYGDSTKIKKIVENAVAKHGDNETLNSVYELLKG